MRIKMAEMLDCFSENQQLKSQKIDIFAGSKIESLN